MIQQWGVGYPIIYFFLFLKFITKDIEVDIKSHRNPVGIFERYYLQGIIICGVIGIRKANCG